MTRFSLALSAVALAAAVAATPATAAYQLINTGGGNGFVVDGPAPYSFTIFGTDEPDECNECEAVATLDALEELPDYLTVYYDVASGPLTIDFRYRYQTFDADGSSYDPAGYVINDEFFQLSPEDSEYFDVLTGIGSFTVQAGDYYGFWVGSTDGAEGLAALSIGAVPEPASWALMIGGFGLTGAALRRRRSLAAA